MMAAQNPFSSITVLLQYLIVYFIISQVAKQGENEKTQTGGSILTVKLNALHDER